MNQPPPQGYLVRHATVTDLDGARRVMLDTFYREFGYGYVPEWHRDVLDLRGTYLDEPRHALLVAECDGEVVATTGVRSGGPAHPPHPLRLSERYSPWNTAQLVRVYVAPAHRRRGLAGALVEAAADFVTGTPGYDRIYLHTNADVEGAEAFWRSLAKEVFDARPTGEHGPGVGTVHFEIPL
ncbi:MULTISPECIES: GNAT family N-acetyltransferase [Streptomyces]|uniref:GNAT superfamily N-acetyltransferase n=1 Tax=Streptomyces clavifer TaxID=68188 RepID=A0ABS4VGJ8_9ACTN|nr:MULTISPECIES: GNAT family N-acetyltransferase [Streptomyces]KQX89095.1 acetyltransferase [Streptomyces sp. Root1319]KQZ05311.1 acetyltransferase [Streptomyces sp. Root55]MBP2363046.1 GNAT superfamily N-acetyltransferase [Streptomyces clavifer]MDX2743013.1 GNAT family N-acetyltransferase [Streptomyces sp. NRRL_B-2557]MDX3065672.1 GNAT family N-acetyltransferase [Streptomyces sp. ND04-05B]